MLSLLHVLHQYFQPVTDIARSGATALIEAVQHIKMDEVFKTNYSVFAFAKLPLIEPEYQRQVHDLPQLWESVDDLINRDEFYLSFSSECQELDLPFPDYDLDSAFIKAQTEWAEEIMVATADYIVKWYEDDIIIDQVASWKNGRIEVNTDLCKNYGDWLKNNYVPQIN